MPCLTLQFSKRRVAPHAGARIEMIGRSLVRNFPDGSPLTQGRELKCFLLGIYSRFGPVAPHAGARIEISPKPRFFKERHVAPHAGARIEISRSFSLSRRSFVAPLAGARIEIGLRRVSSRSCKVAPLAGARIEIWKLLIPPPPRRSPLSQGRELKSSGTSIYRSRPPSPLSQGRELKYRDIIHPVFRAGRPSRRGVN